MRATRMLVALMALTSLAASAAAEEVKLGYVDAERVFKESKIGMQAVQRLKKMEEEKKQEIRTLESRIDQLEEELELQGSIMSETARMDKEEQIRRHRIDLKRAAEDAERDLRRLEKTYLERIDNEVIEIIQQIGKQDGFTMIVGNVMSGVLYVSPAIDLTDRVIAAYDRQQMESN